MTYKETNEQLKKLKFIIFSQHYPEEMVEAVAKAINLLDVVEEVGLVRIECYNIAEDRICKENREVNFYDYLEVFCAVVRDGLCTEELVEEEKKFNMLKERKKK